ncbi:MAG TPA: aminotransferase class V-fold PLP-dependent enzyme [Novosphingobium sp.]|nr:aminotransferase class V-fold PLP-dependent enzyme [Novosphingobium sp.]
MTPTFDLDLLRARFPSLPRLTYFNSGSYGLLAREVRAAFDTYLDRREEVGADWGGWVIALEQAREKVARLLSVSGDEVAITASASAGINAVASALDYAARPKVIVSNFEFPSGAQIWHAQERAGAQVVHVPESEDGLIPLDHFLREIDASTAIVALSQVCYRNGGRTPDADIRAICQMAQAKGALVLLDGYQMVGTCPVEPAALGVDFYVGGFLKYLLGTAGAGFLYASAQATRALTPRTSGWFTQADIEAMDIFANTPSPTARRFEAGTPPVPSLGAVSAGLDLVLDLGLPAIGAWVSALSGHALHRLDEAGIAVGSPVAPDRRGPLLTIPARDDNALVAALAQHDIVTSCRDGRLRAGFHAYNTLADVDHLVDALVANRALLA